MERLISLFREPDYEQWSPSQLQRPPPHAHEEPLYFQQLLAYLRQERRARSAPAQENEDADDMIGAAV